MNSDRISLAFFSYAIGHTSEVWMWRQIKGFKKFNPHILTWNYLNSEEYSLNGMPLEIIPFQARPEQQPGLGRWLYRLKCLPYLNFYASIGQEQRYIEELIFKIKPKVILCQFSHVALRILPIAKKQKVPIVVHFHGLGLSSSLKSDKWYRWSIFSALRKFDALVVVGSHEWRRVLERGTPEEKVHLIPCGVPTDIFQYFKRQHSKEVRFICVSRLIEGKGIEYSIRALAEVRKQMNNVSMIIVGDGPLKENLKNLSNKLGLNNFIMFSGRIDSDRHMQYLRESDIFLQHSIKGSDGWEEGFGVSIAEASATGLPVICTNCGGIPDQVIDGITGFVVEQKDVHAMADRMLRLARDSVLREIMGKAGRERMVTNFDTQKQINKLEMVLLNCCSKNL